MNTTRRYLQRADQSNDTNTYRYGFLYKQEDLAEEVNKLRKGNKYTHNRLREMISNGSLRSIKLSTKASDLMLVELAIFGCNLLLVLPGLFPPGYMTNSRFNWVERELCVLVGLKEMIEKGEHLSNRGETFLTDVRNDKRHILWIMDLILSVKTFGNVNEKIGGALWPARIWPRSCRCNVGKWRLSASWIYSERGSVPGVGVGVLPTLKMSAPRLGAGLGGRESVGSIDIKQIGSNA